MTAPTEAEILEAVQARLDASEGMGGTTGDGLRADLRLLCRDAAMWLRSPAWDVIESPDPRSDEDDFDGRVSPWSRDMRPSEARKLMALTDAACERAAARCEAILLEEITAAGVAFATEFPDAVRSRVLAKA